MNQKSSSHPLSTRPFLRQRWGRHDAKRRQASIGGRGVYRELVADLQGYRLLQACVEFEINASFLLQLWLFG